MKRSIRDAYRAPVGVQLLTVGRHFTPLPGMSNELIAYRRGQEAKKIGRGKPPSDPALAEMWRRGHAGETYEPGR